MSLPEQLLLSDLLRHRGCSDIGIDHGPGFSAWMHPPVHRLLGWVTRPSSLRLSREVFRLDQLRGVSTQEVYVKGNPSITEQGTFDRIPVDPQYIIATCSSTVRGEPSFSQIFL